MICPACGGRHFAPVRIEGGLPAERCADCHGAWVELERYRLWRKNMPQLAAPEYAGEISEVNEPVRVCPSTGRLMTRIKVSNDNPLRLDFSAMAQAVWLDKGEWERLLAMGLHDQLDAIVSERWQSDLKRAASRERAEHAMRLRFGDAAYEQLAQMRAWLAQQPNQTEMMAFLNTKAD
ncbi:zf-TFIIB domain-containing protein [Massilia sp. CCM 9210]|uniref:zf-TFIIB domain-containing protein n=1 Tax=Massilia scottii TaxID=3057166 RepID=UPI0027968061|nr:zf-TFIIB domain-containing protein [Massilia sp. CCM 9210]MDQ1815659.1 zf-TFIIB domain-containing protein [Massilia sp. CCM 9210]